MLILHYFPNSCAFTPQVALEWSGLPYENRLETRESIKTPDYLRLNPMGQVPLLEDGAFALTQNAAIIHYVHELAPQAGIFGKGDAKAQAKARQWLAFANADLHARSYSLIFGAARLLEDESAQKALADKGRENVLRAYGVVNDALNGRDYLNGELTIADVYVYVTLRWAKAVGVDTSALANLAPYFARVEADPGVRKIAGLHSA